jgi:DNA segregation ATPase FtsK/SpoIIIE, S-DNA-T family
MTEQRRIRNDLVAVGLLALIVFLMATLGTYDPADRAFEASPLLSKIYQPDQLVYPPNEQFNNACGRWGAWTADMLLHTLGLGAYYLLIGLIAMEVALFRRQGFTSPWLKTFGWFVSLIGLTSLCSLLLPPSIIRPVVGTGGYLGLLAKSLMVMNIGFAGALIASACTFVLGMMMWTEYLVFRAGKIVFAPAFFAVTSMLPFGLLYSFGRWFNGLKVRPQRRSTDLEQQIELEEALSAEPTPQFRQDAGHPSLTGPRTIKFRRRDLELDDLDEELGPAKQDSNEDFEQDSLEEDVEAHDYDTIEEEPVQLKIADVKLPDPALHMEEAAASTPSVPIPKPHFKMKKSKPAAPPSEREIVMKALNHADEHDAISNYQLPSIEMLSYAESVPFEEQKQDAERNAIILEKTCKEFGYDVKVVEIEIGPVISQYEIDLAPGLRLQKIVALAGDLAIAMRVPSVRVVAPIPGKNSVGVEVPNKSRQDVTLRQLMEQSEKQIQKMKIPLFLGADAVGAPLVADLASLPHLLIAGRTGTGKSVCLNAIIASILMTRRPEEVRMLMIDPKMVELSGYERLPHLMHPVVTDMRKAEAILAWAVDKMEERYALLAQVGVRHVTSFNQLGAEEIYERLHLETADERAAIPTNLPFIVIVADEMADLMMTAGKEVEAHIIRLAQKSRAVGIHLILATQKPTVDVITGLIKSNLPARIAFQVASQVDSRVVIDTTGADKLLGRGDMLFLAPGTSTLLRGQGTYLSDREIELITEAVSTGEQNFVHELVNIKVKDDSDETDGTPKKLENRDKLYEEAVTLVVREQRGSTSMLQQKMGIGYGRAARLIDFMAEDGYLGPYNGSKAREVLLTEAQWAAVRAGGSESDDELPDESVARPRPALPASQKSPVNLNKPMNQVGPSTRLDSKESDDRHPTPKPKSGRKPLTPLENKTGLTSSLAAKSGIMPAMPAKPKSAVPPIRDDNRFDDEDEDLEEFEDDDESSGTLYENVDNEDDEYEDDAEAAADQYDEDEPEEDDDYEYEDDEDYEDVE